MKVSYNMRLWHTLKGDLMLDYPHTVFMGKTRQWGFSLKRFALVINEDTTSPYSVLHVGPFEFFIRPRSVMMF